MCVSSPIGPDKPLNHFRAWDSGLEILKHLQNESCKLNIEQNVLNLYVKNLDCNVNQHGFLFGN